MVSGYNPQLGYDPNNSQYYTNYSRPFIQNQQQGGSFGIQSQSYGPPGDSWSGASGAMADYYFNAVEPTTNKAGETYRNMMNKLKSAEGGEGGGGGGGGSQQSGGGGILGGIMNMVTAPIKMITSIFGF